MARVECYVEGLSQNYQDGLERVELYLCREFAHHVTPPPPKEKVEVIVETNAGEYQGWLRSYEASHHVYLTPTLICRRTGRRTTLAHVLKGLEIESRQRLEVEVQPNKWTIIGPA